MREQYAYISTYVDKAGTIYAIPCGWDRITQSAVNTSDIDLLFILKPPYSDDDIEAFLLNALENCYKKEKEPGPGPLEKHFGVSSWLRAVKGLRYVYFSWNKMKGYQFIASIKMPQKGYVSLKEEQRIHVENNPEKGELARAFYKALSESKC